MSEDIVYRLVKLPVRVQISGSYERDCYEAANEIERLRADLAAANARATGLTSERDFLSDEVSAARLVAQHNTDWFDALKKDFDQARADLAARDAKLAEAATLLDEADKQWAWGAAKSSWYERLNAWRARIDALTKGDGE